MVFLHKLSFLILLVPSVAFAADLHCGRDTDRNGSVDVACRGRDADHDGYDDVAYGGTDCDDTNWQVYPGISTEGASNDTFKTCQSNGSFTVSAALSGYTCHTGSGSTYWVDDGETDCTGAGTYADPEDYRCWFNTGMSGYHAPSAGDCIVFQPGTYSAVWSTTKMLELAVSGTASHQIHIEAAPGKTVVLDSPGADPTKIKPVDLQAASYVTINGNAVAKKPGFDIGDGYANDGINVKESHNVTIQNVYVHDVDGAQATDGSNGGGIDVGNLGASNNVTIRAVHLKNNYSRAGATNINNNQLDVFRGTGLRVLYSVLEDTVGGGAGNGMFYKHGDVSGDCDYEVTGNVFAGASNYQLWLSCGGGTIRHNVFLNPLGMAVSFGGGHGATYWQTGSLFEYNTVYNGAGPEVFVIGSYEQSSTFGLVTIQKNVFYDERGSAYGIDGADGFYRICHYCTNSIYTAVIGGLKVLFNSNILYNSASTAMFFTVFGDAGTGASGTTASSCAAWLALGLNISTNEVCGNPSLGSDLIAGAAEAADMGWRTQADLVVESNERGGFFPWLAMLSPTAQASPYPGVHSLVRAEVR